MLKRTIDWLAGKIAKRSLMAQMLDARRSLAAGGSAVNIPVTERTAIKFSAVFASVRIIAETKASLPIDVFERRSSGKDAEVKDHRVATLLGFDPHEDFTPMIFNEVRQAHLCLWGNSYTEIEFDGRSPEISRLTPRAPWDVQPFRGQDGRMYYRITDGERGSRVVDRSQMLHIPGFGFNGLIGMSVVRHFMAESIAIGMAADRFVASFYGNSGRPSIVVEVPEMLDDQAYGRLKDGVEQQLQQWYKPLLLEHGASLKAWTMPLAEAQLLESRKFQGEEIAARGFRLPPHVAGYLDHAKFNNIESQDRYFEKHTMRPWLIRDEQAMNKTLFLPSERGRYYVKINSDGILRGDLKTRYDAYRLALLAGWKTINEVRELEDLEPLEGGDVLPRPAAIWGKDDPTMDPVNPGGEGDSRIDPRLQAITAQTVRGLVHREAVQLKRLAAKPHEFRQAVDAFYSRHAGIVSEKLGPVSGSQERLAQLVESHRQEILAESHGRSDLREIVDRCVQAWDRSAGQVADGLLLDAYHQSGPPDDDTEKDDED